MQKFKLFIAIIMGAFLLYILFFTLDNITKAEKKLQNEKTISIIKSEGECCSIVMTQHWDGEFQLTKVQYILYNAGDGKVMLDSIDNLKTYDIDGAVNGYMEFCYKYHQ